MQILDEIFSSGIGGESITIEFDFAGELDAIDNLEISVTPVNGVDPAAASMLDGSHQISGASVFQRIRPGVPGLNYSLVCRAVRGADARIRRALLPVRAA